MIAKSIKWMFFSAILFLLILAGCSPAGEVGPTVTPNISVDEFGAEDDPIIADESSSESDAIEDQQSTESDDVEVEELKPLPKQELSATDPDTVNLASGEPQLVEFFAFW